jgi:hypothetical protein
MVMTMSKRLIAAARLASLLSALAFAIPAQAAPPSGGSEHHSSDRGTRGDFRGGEFRDHHRRHDFDDRFGFGFGGGDWWGWDPYWYPYYAYYPYPPYPAYAPPAAPAPQEPVQAMGAPPQQYWYHCDNPEGYYPYVANCTSAWRPVVPTPPASNTISPKP